ncbi:MAG: type II toxin-antitoxin system VapC family toxin [Gemmatimonadota bacterium]
MRVLLDTHVWLWMVADPERLPQDAVALLEDPGNELLFSAASSFEIAIKCALGKLRLPASPSRYVPQQIERTGVTPIAIEHGHALAVADLPPHHRDPFDRLLVATAQLEAVPLMTADQQLAPYDVEIRWLG